MVKQYLAQGVVTTSPGNNNGVKNFDFENYIISVLGKTETCCLKEIIVTSLATDTITESTAAAGVTVDGLLIKDSGISANSMFGAFYPTAAQNNIAAGTGGAISVANYLTTINTDAGGDAFTVAAGTQKGQMKKILLVADGGGDATITLTGYTSIVMGDAADYVIMMWNGAAWFVVENSGATVNA